MATQPSNQEGMTASQFPDDPEGWHRRWQAEFTSAKEKLKPFHEQGDRVVKRYLDKNTRGTKSDRTAHKKLNLWTANVQILQALLYGKTPKVDVSRKFADAGDDIARVASEMLERCLNSDIQKSSDSYAMALEQALSDRLIPGFGLCRVRFEAKFDDPQDEPEAPESDEPQTDEYGQELEAPPILDENGQELAPAVPKVKQYKGSCEVDYVHWKDCLWSVSRTFGEWRWCGFRLLLSREKCIEKFGEEIGSEIPLNAKDSGITEDRYSKEEDPWTRAEIWEIWDKENGKIWFYNEDHGQIIGPPQGMEANHDGSINDPLQLERFWSFPRPLTGFLSTDAYVPQSDFRVAQDLYDEVDDYTRRIHVLQKALRVAGLYNRAAGTELGRLIDEAGENELIPVDGWAAFADKGGIEGQVVWLPIKEIVETLSQLRELRTEAIQLLYQVTGMSDIMRGQANEQTTATEQSIKAKFASVRVQAIQDKFAQFASDIQAIKAEIICRHYDDQTILDQSNIMNTPDADRAQEAIAFLRSKFECLRIEIKPEAVAMQDMAALKAEKTEVLTGLTSFLQVASQAATAMPQSAPFLMKIGAWFMQGFKGTQEIQGVFEDAVKAAEQAQQQAAMQPPQQPPPDPKLQTAMMKGKMDQQKTAMELQADLVRLNAETQAHAQQANHSAAVSVQEDAAKQKLKAADPLNRMLNPQGVEG